VKLLQENCIHVTLMCVCVSAIKSHFIRLVIDSVSLLMFWATERVRGHQMTPGRGL